MGNQRVIKSLLLLSLLVMLFVAVPATFAAEEAAGPLDALGINAGFLIAQLVNFGLLFAILSVILWRPLVNMLDARSAKIQKGLEDAAAAANARMTAEVEADKILAASRTEAQSVIEAARAQGEEVARTVEAEARREGDSIREQARYAATEERNRQLAELREQISAISVAIARQLIGKSLVDEAQQKQLINDFFTKLPQGAQSLTGTIQVVSAVPLTEAEQTKISGQLGSDDVEFTVDPDILGGIIIRSADRLIDGSVRRGLGDITERMR